MNRTPEFFARNSHAACYGAAMAPATRKQEMSPERSFGNVMHRMALAGAAVAVAMSIMAPHAQAAGYSLARSPMEEASFAMENATKAMHADVDDRTAILKSSGKSPCYIVKRMSFGTPHVRRYEGDITRFASVHAVDCAVVAVTNERSAAILFELSKLAEEPPNAEFFRRLYAPLSVQTLDVAFAIAATLNDDNVQTASEPLNVSFAAQ